MEDVQLDVPNLFVTGLTTATEKITGFPLVYCAEKIDVRDTRDIQIESKGPFQSTMRFRLEQSFEQAVLEKMMNGKELSIEIRKLYLGEYINILSGNALTLINNAVGKTSRLTVPTVGNDSIRDNTQYKHKFEVYFTSQYGNMQFEMSYEL